MSESKHESSSVMHFDIDQARHKTLADTKLYKYFKAAVQHKTSDLLMRGGEPPKLRSCADVDGGYPRSGVGGWSWADVAGAATPTAPPQRCCAAVGKLFSSTPRSF